MGNIDLDSLKLSKELKEELECIISIYFDEIINIYNDINNNIIIEVIYIFINRLIYYQ